MRMGLRRLVRLVAVVEMLLGVRVLLVVMVVMGVVAEEEDAAAEEDVEGVVVVVAVVGEVLEKREIFF